jgi:hypothetical protein
MTQRIVRVLSRRGSRISGGIVSSSGRRGGRNIRFTDRFSRNEHRQRHPQYRERKHSYCQLRYEKEQKVKVIFASDAAAHERTVVVSAAGAPPTFMAVL